MICRAERASFPDLRKELLLPEDYDEKEDVEEDDGNFKEILFFLASIGNYGTQWKRGSFNMEIPHLKKRKSFSFLIKPRANGNRTIVIFDWERTYYGSDYGPAIPRNCPAMNDRLALLIWVIDRLVEPPHDDAYPRKTINLEACEHCVKMMMSFFKK